MTGDPRKSEVWRLTPPSQHTWFVPFGQILLKTPMMGTKNSWGLRDLSPRTSTQRPTLISIKTIGRNVREVSRRWLLMAQSFLEHLQKCWQTPSLFQQIWVEKIESVFEVSHQRCHLARRFNNARFWLTKHFSCFSIVSNICVHNLA